MLPSYGWRPIGGYRVVYEYANRLAARGHEVAVVHPRRLAAVRNTNPLVRRWGARTRDLLLRPSMWWQPIDPRVRMLYVREPVADEVPDGDVVFATAWQTVEYVRDYPASKGRKHYLVQDFYPWLGSRETLEATWRLPLAKVAVSTWLQELVLAAGGRDVVAIANGVDTARMRLLASVEDRLARTPCHASRRSGEVVFPDMVAPKLLANRWPLFDER